MRVELPSGNYAEIRERLVPGDRLAVTDAPDVIAEGGKVVIQNAGTNKMLTALGRLVESWSFPVAPAAAFSAGAKVLDDLMDLDDWDALEKAIEPLMDRLSPAPNQQGPSRPSSKPSELTTSS